MAWSVSFARQFGGVIIFALFTSGEEDGRVMEELEELIWDPEAGVTDRQIDQFLVIARYVEEVGDIVSLSRLTSFYFELREKSVYIKHTENPKFGVNFSLKFSQ